MDILRGSPSGDIWKRVVRRHHHTSSASIISGRSEFQSGGVSFPDKLGVATAERFLLCFGTKNQVGFDTTERKQEV